MRGANGLHRCDARPIVFNYKPRSLLLAWWRLYLRIGDRAPQLWVVRVELRMIRRQPSSDHKSQHMSQRAIKLNLHRGCCTDYRTHLRHVGVTRGKMLCNTLLNCGYWKLDELKSGAEYNVEVGSL